MHKETALKMFRATWRDRCRLRPAGRHFWSNWELLGCHSRASGLLRATASCVHRIKQQMANEAPFVDALIAWEWTSCLSALAGRLL